MPRLSELRPSSFDELVRHKDSSCQAFKNKLNAEAFEVRSIEKTPEQVADAVLRRGGEGLKLFERRELPNLILLHEYEPYQPDFAASVLRDFSADKRFWGRLMRAWIREYPVRSELAPRVAAALQKNIHLLPEQLAKLVSDHGLLNIPAKLAGTAESVLNNRLPVETLRVLGLDQQGNVSTKLFAQILVACANYLRSGAASESELQTFQYLVAPRGTIESSSQMSAMVGLTLGAANRSPGEDRVKELSSILEQSFGDPVSESQGWPSVLDELGGEAVRAECLEVARKWNVFRSIHLFFKIIGKVVESEHRHHFPMRRDFWMNYFDRGDVTEARVILGSKARDEVERLKKRQGGEYADLDYAELRGGPADQCALLLKLGKTTVMEFSHSGRARMWGAADGAESPSSSVPKFRRASYQAADLRAPCPDDQMFRHDPRGQWRVHARNCIARLAGGAVVL